MKKINNFSIIKFIVFAFAIILPFAMSISTLKSGNIDFGYDSARDFISGLDNLHKLTLIGPTSGIPGLFYGPYWIWLISLGLLFSQNPAWVVFIILTIPYFIIFPFVLFQFRKIFGFATCLILWVLFIFSTGMKYATSPWNPHPAPLLFLILIYILAVSNFSENDKSKHLKALLAGLVSGLILNFHISFGVGSSFGVITFFIFEFIMQVLKQKNKLGKILISHTSKLGMYFFGVLITFSPFFVFEQRHGYLQIKTILKVFQTKGSVVTVVGLNKVSILQNFFGTSSILLKLPMFFGISVFVFSIIYFAYILRQKKILLSYQENRLFLFLLSSVFGILFVYLTSKNPVWSYHFIGVEIIFLMFIGLIIGKVKVLRVFLAIWIVITLMLDASGIANAFHQNPYVNSSSLATEEKIVHTIASDAKGSKFNVFAYSPSIYTYEYKYLFKWIVKYDVSYDPGLNHINTDTVYLIIPNAKNEIKQNFINYRTPSDKFKTLNKWKLQDGTLIIKREFIVKD